MTEKFVEKKCTDLNEFWELLSPQKLLKRDPSNFIYRGQRDSSWGLIPSILREEDNPANRISGSMRVTCEDQVFAELRILEHFVEQCDSLGLNIIKDSIEFREKNLSTQNAGIYFKKPVDWPNKNLLEILALAQHHGVPTRLLDWSKRSYVAAYFAASSALENRKKWKPDDSLAVWALDIERINLYRNISIIRVPGSTSKNLAAQTGIFTLHRQEGMRGQLFEFTPIETEFARLSETPLFKITIPVSESKGVLELCKLFGVTASTLIPGFDGAAKATLDSMNCWEQKQNL